MSEVARNARQVSRFLDELVTAYGETGENIGKGIPLEQKSSGAATGRLYLQTENIATQLPPTLASGKADNQILGVVTHLAHAHQKRSVILVSEKTSTCDQGAHARHGRRGLLQRQGPRGHPDLLYAGRAASAGFLGSATARAWSPRSRAATRITAFTARSSRRSSQRVPVPREEGRGAVLRGRQGHPGQDARCCRRSRTTPTKDNVWGITARDREQNFALNLLMNPRSTSSRCSARPAPARRC